VVALQQQQQQVEAAGRLVVGLLEVAVVGTQLL